MNTTAKITKRKVFDGYVKDRLEGCNEEAQLFESIKTYQQDVKTSLDRVCLARSQNGLIPKSITSHFNATLKQILQDSDTDSPCAVNLVTDGKIVRSFNMNYREARMLKALAIEQVSYNGEYTEVVSAVFQNMMQAVLNGTHVVIWQCPVEFTNVQEIMYRAFTKDIDKYLERREMA